MIQKDGERALHMETVAFLLLELPKRCVPCTPKGKSFLWITEIDKGQNIRAEIGQFFVSVCLWGGGVSLSC